MKVVGFLRPNKDFWTEKTFGEPRNWKKNIFLLEPELYDLTKSGFWLPEGYLVLMNSET